MAPDVRSQTIRRWVRGLLKRKLNASHLIELVKSTCQGPSIRIGYITSFHLLAFPVPNPYCHAWIYAQTALWLLCRHPGSVTEEGEVQLERMERTHVPTVADDKIGSAGEHRAQRRDMPDSPESPKTCALLSSQGSILVG